ncbi:MAG: DMT family transporter [Acidimicrobiales bacterium]
MTRATSPADRTIHRPPAGDLALLGVAILAVSTSAPMIREADAPTLAIAFWRNALACLVLWPWVAARQRVELRTLTRSERRRSMLAGLWLAVHFATWVPSLSFTSVASSVALVATQPVWAALLARARGAHVPRQTWVGIAVALTGVVVLSGVDFSLSGRALFGDALALIGGVMAAVYVTIGADVRRTVTTSVYTAVCYSVAAVVLAGICVGGRQPLAGYDGRTWLLLVAMAIGPQLLGHSVINRVLRSTSATVVSVAILFEIVGSAFLAWAWFGEAPPAGAYPAAVLIGAGIVLVVRSGGLPGESTTATAAPLAAD